MSGIEINIDGTNPNSGGGFSENSKCHVVVEGYENKLAESQQIAVTFLSVHSTVESQIGKKRTEYFSFAPAKPGKNPPVNKFLELACALGVYSKPQWKADLEAKRNPSIELDSIIGRSCCAPVVVKEFDEKYWTDRLQEAQSKGDQVTAEKAEKQLSERRKNITVGGDYGFTFWALGDPDADSVPLDQDCVPVSISGPLPTKMGTTRIRGSKTVAGATGGNTAAVNKPAPPAGGAANSGATANSSFF